MAYYFRGGGTDVPGLPPKVSANPAETEHQRWRRPLCSSSADYAMKDLHNSTDVLGTSSTFGGQTASDSSVKVFGTFTIPVHTMQLNGLFSEAEGTKKKSDCDCPPLPTVLQTPNTQGVSHEQAEPPTVELSAVLGFPLGCCSDKTFSTYNTRRVAWPYIYARSCRSHKSQIPCWEK